LKNISYYKLNSWVDMVMGGVEIELAVVEHNIVGDIVALVVASVVPVVLVVQPVETYIRILHKTSHYPDLDNHTLGNI
jgi:hypothetical protein